MLSNKNNDNSIGMKSTSRLVFTSQENIDSSVQLPDRNPVVVPKTFPSLVQVQAYNNFDLILKDKLILITPFIFIFCIRYKFPSSLTRQMFLKKHFTFLQSHTFLHERNLFEQQHCYKKAASISGPIHSCSERASLDFVRCVSYLRHLAVGQLIASLIRPHPITTFYRRATP